MVIDSPVPSWRVAWSTDRGESWEELGFEYFREAQGRAVRLLSEEGEGIAISVERMMPIDLESFICAKSARDVKLAPLRIGTAETFA